MLCLTRPREERFRCERDITWSVRAFYALTACAHANHDQPEIHRPQKPGAGQRRLSQRPVSVPAQTPEIDQPT